MPARRILSLWFPRLGAERLLRLEQSALEAPLAVIGDHANGQVITSLSVLAEAEGLRLGQPLSDARALCPGLLTRPRILRAELALLSALRRWAGKFSPWVAEDPPGTLMLDLTGCAHLFGGEAALATQIEADCTDLGLTVRLGLADTVGAAWALARFAGVTADSVRSGDAIDQEARATRSRAVKRRHWERGGASPATAVAQGTQTLRIAPPGLTRQVLNPLPIAALRLEPGDVAALARLGLRRIEDLAAQPRAGLARRFGQGVVMRMDQAFGAVPEPVSPAAAPPRFALRMTLPEPIGLESDLIAGIDRLLARLETKLRAAGQGARTVRFQAFRCDRRMEEIEIGLARPSADPDRIRPLLILKLGQIDAGPGIDCLRLEAPVTEPVHATQHKGHLDAARDAVARQTDDTRLDDLIGRLGARLSPEAVTRKHPVDTHIPEKTAQVLAAAWSAPAAHWPPTPTPRPLLCWRPEPVTPIEEGPPPAKNAPRRLSKRFVWRRREYCCVATRGPERICPEWWLDDPNWRSGVRDYWQVTTADGASLWLYYAHGGTLSAGWFCQGAFA
ncbi:DNA polymerase Y family protein [Pseudoruegeria sp. SK021]|uniref:Y-family DNA polymerase n=1 Tax=Pseudoruegeria sp. SK021 TaxID=1933035 RepID=UPI000A217B3D|nr:DNA polymerase Y family protein [Pseudoruegeria sp. SK021]OSP56791.1 DNA methylase [Pseudoruegeria sp. SK021]